MITLLCKQKYKHTHSYDDVVVDSTISTWHTNITLSRTHKHTYTHVHTHLVTQVNDDVVVDSTNCGGISRFCNHCCMPSLYTRVGV
jgi:hypothetical protein